MRKTIKQQILDRLNEGYTLTYGQANNLTNSQSGYRRFQEILKENPEKYEYVKVKSENGGYYHVFAQKKCFYVWRTSAGYHFVCGKNDDFISKESYKTRKEARVQIKNVVR
jgi:hypothetical protein